MCIQKFKFKWIVAQVRCIQDDGKAAATAGAMLV
jgi:hypothetical protein